ncbi:uncharacterized protein RJT21DRAFT_127648 [Scheffersomyces amazonensis]|uniref:uncharacterized protein n=1 Tax=Scheffersomyces amazonensis TaxID=1078765 RepID=UPI00315D5F3A
MKTHRTLTMLNRIEFHELSYKEKEMVEPTDDLNSDSDVELIDSYSYATKRKDISSDIIQDSQVVKRPKTLTIEEEGESSSHNNGMSLAPYNHSHSPIPDINSKVEDVFRKHSLIQVDWFNDMRDDILSRLEEQRGLLTTFEGTYDSVIPEVVHYVRHVERKVDEMEEDILGGLNHMNRNTLEEVSKMKDDSMRESIQTKADVLKQVDSVKKYLSVNVESMKEDIMEGVGQMKHDVTSMKKDVTKDVSHMKKDVLKELNQVKKESTKGINQLRKDIIKELSQVRKESSKETSQMKQALMEEVNSIRVDTTTEINQMKKDTTRELNLIKEDIILEFQDMKEDLTTNINKSNLFALNELTRMKNTSKEIKQKQMDIIKEVKDTKQNASKESKSLKDFLSKEVDQFREIALKELIQTKERSEDYDSSKQLNEGLDVHCMKASLKEDIEMKRDAFFEILQSKDTVRQVIKESSKEIDQINARTIEAFEDIKGEMSEEFNKAKEDTIEEFNEGHKKTADELHQMKEIILKEVNSIKSETSNEIKKMKEHITNVDSKMDLLMNMLMDLKKDINGNSINNGSSNMANDISVVSAIEASDEEPDHSDNDKNDEDFEYISKCFSMSRKIKTVTEAYDEWYSSVLKAGKANSRWPTKAKERKYFQMRRRMIKRIDTLAQELDIDGMTLAEKIEQFRIRGNLTLRGLTLVLNSEESYRTFKQSMMGDIKKDINDESSCSVT